MNPTFWAGKNVLITGHTGFKGGWLAFWLSEMGAKVSGISLPPPTKPSFFEVCKLESRVAHFEADIRDSERVKGIVSQVKPEILFHLAAQPLVRRSYQEPIETYSTNVMGTMHVLEAMRAAGSVRTGVFITTDKCYENREWVWGYRETDPMGGFDPYSSSKGCAELLISSYRRSFFPENIFDKHRKSLASARAGNVIGGGDWAEDRLIPDIIKAFMKNESVRIRNPLSIRPWQHVLEPLSGYLCLAEKMTEEPGKFGEGWNFGPHDTDAKPVEWIVEFLRRAWGDGAAFNVDPGPHPHEAHFLKLDTSKAKSFLGWTPRWALDIALTKTVEWFRAMRNGDDMGEVSRRQIRDYLAS